ncbi:CHAP domain-containing protein [Flexivirga meconopsidis]|uniref:CHAP domain-containing protein n=1 Tax=Flexivirga meconopsidis TaxID=2977121 RepID=UPI00223FD5F0|nr:CHAP domain-containing protein [Flexivirga meconopsidis]
MLTKTARRATSLAIAAATLTGALTAAGGTAGADQVTNFPAKVDLNGRLNIGEPADAPGHIENQYLQGAQVPVVCQQFAGADLWDKTADNTWVPDKYLTTGTDGRAPGVPDCNPAPPSAGEEPRDDFNHQTYGFAKDQCTAFAAFRVADRLGIGDFANDWRGQHFGDAGNWDDAARGAGLVVDTQPVVGGIAVNDVHKVGHVAYINKVYDDGSFDVEEYNWNTPLGYGTRSHVNISDAQADFQYVIHFK